MSRTSRGVTPTWPVSMRLILDAEHSSFSPTSSMVSWAASRSRRSSLSSLRRRTVGLLPLAMGYHPLLDVVEQMLSVRGALVYPVWVFDRFETLLSSVRVMQLAKSGLLGASSLS